MNSFLESCTAFPGFPCGWMVSSLDQKEMPAAGIEGLVMLSTCASLEKHVPSQHVIQTFTLVWQLPTVDEPDPWWWYLNNGVCHEYQTQFQGFSAVKPDGGL